MAEVPIKGLVIEALMKQGYDRKLAEEMVVILFRGWINKIDVVIDPDNPDPFSNLRLPKAEKETFDPLPIGKHKGVPLKDVPYDYLSWIRYQPWFQEKFAYFADEIDRFQKYKANYAVEQLKKRLKGVF